MGKKNYYGEKKPLIQLYIFQYGSINTFGTQFFVMEFMEQHENKKTILIKKIRHVTYFVE